MLSQEISIDDYEEMLKEDQLTDFAMGIMKSLLNDIRPFATKFRANTDDLLNLAEKHSVTFQQITEGQQLFFIGIMKSPIFFLSEEKQ